MTTVLREAVAPGPRAGSVPVPDPEPASHEVAADPIPGRWVPLLLVAFAVAFSAWMLRPELRGVLFGNDAAGHDSMVRFAAQRIRAGHNPFDAWYPYLGLGAPHFVQYQSLAHIVTGLLSIVFGGRLFRWETYVLICTWPISVYAGGRLLGLDRWQAGAASLFSPMLSNVTGYGIEWKSFIWSGSGLWSMLFGIWLLPVALGLAWCAIARGERIALATFVVGLTCALHFMTGYLVLLAFVVFVLVRRPEFVYRLGRSAIIGLGGLAIFAFVFVPALRELPFDNVNAFEVGTYWFNSYGPHQVLAWLVEGEVFDHGRLPVITVLVFVGVVVCLTRVRCSEVSRIVLALFALSLALYSGRSVVGPVVDYLPGGSALYLHRYVMAVHLAGMWLAGIAAVWLFRHVVAFAPRVARMRSVHAVAVATIASAVVLFPVLADRAHLAAANARFVSNQVRADRGAGRDVVALIDIAKQRGDGRIYAGATNNWGMSTKVGEIPLVLFPVQEDADSIGLDERTSSLSADVEPYFDDTRLAEYDLFNVRYVLVPAHRKPGVAAKLLARRGGYALYEVQTSGYLEVVDTTAPLRADRSDIYAIARPYISSAAVAHYRHPFVSFDGAATPAPSLTDGAPDTGPPGTVTASHADLDNGRFTGDVHLVRPGWVMLKESYAPHWTATVDGKPVRPAMLAPSFVGIPVPAGTHHVVFAYRSGSSYPLLFTVGAITLAGLAIVPWAGRRRRRRARVPATVA